MLPHFVRSNAQGDRNKNLVQNQKRKLDKRPKVLKPPERVFLFGFIDEQRVLHCDKWRAFWF